MTTRPEDPRSRRRTRGVEQERSFSRTLAFALSSRRTLAVTLLSFSSGLPLGLVWIAIPVWLRQAGVDIRIVGLLTLTQAPWSFKLLWSPLMDRYALPWLGRRRGWIALTQIVLFALGLLLAGLGQHPETPWVVVALCLAIACASASQDIVIDAYAVDVLHPEEQGVAVGARTAVYRAAMYVAGSLSITLAGFVSWPVVSAALAALYLPMLIVTRLAPEPQQEPPAPSTLAAAVWEPFLGFLGRHRALEILAFVLLYKLGDNLAQSLMRPFLVDMGYNEVDIGVALGTVGLFCTLAGTFLGGVLTTGMGLGHALWIFGLLQIFSNLGYILVARVEVHRPLMFGAMAFETLTTGMGMGAFGVLLLRMTQKRFSATQYALFSSLFGLPRILAGPVTGFVVHAAGWVPFFWLTMAAGVPGLVMLARFVPPGTREPRFRVESPRDREPLTRRALAWRALAGGVAGFVLTAFTIAGLAALEALGDGRAAEVFSTAVRSTLVPTDLASGLRFAASTAVGLVAALLTGAVIAARHLPARATADGEREAPQQETRR